MADAAPGNRGRHARLDLDLTSRDRSAITCLFPALGNGWTEGLGATRRAAYSRDIQTVGFWLYCASQSFSLICGIISERVKWSSGSYTRMTTREFGSCGPSTGYFASPDGSRNARFVPNRRKPSGSGRDPYGL